MHCAHVFCWRGWKECCQLTTHCRGWNECLPNDNLLPRVEQVLVKRQPIGDAGTNVFQITHYQGWNELVQAQQNFFNDLKICDDTRETMHCVHVLLASPERVFVKGQPAGEAATGA
ncbi:hypothetical protein EGW08_023766 [Elysia chlorotica]|uniref:Uncharacterized protein n=1 Tax=Elysia chlorotica TaxID=188477 RepID=A0A3S1AUA1_ELYCH|nr:hypothetical protein EGW08_023766 [Elysia chlorotica]